MGCRRQSFSIWTCGWSGWSGWPSWSGSPGAAAAAGVGLLILTVSLALGDSARTVRPAPASSLGDRTLAAWRRGDLDETTRLAQHDGRPAMQAALAGPRTEAIAAAWAMASGGGPWALAGLSKLAQSADRRRASAAVAAALTLSAQLTPEAAAEEDLDGTALANVRAQWLHVAQRDRGFIAVRVDSLTVAVRLGRVAQALGASLPPLREAGLLGDADPAMRRAALESLEEPLAAVTRQQLGAALLEEPDPEVARAIAAALCVDVGVDPAATLAASGRARVQQLASQPLRRAAADVELARCLAQDASPASRRALRQLTAAADGELRRALEAVARGMR